jgi:magnesium transporter
MDPAQADHVRGLLVYGRGTAGGMMTTRYVTAPAWLQVGDAVRFLRDQLAAPAWVDAMYVVTDLREQQLLGILPLRDLLLASPLQPLRDVMAPIARAVDPQTPAVVIAQVLADYDLLSLPVIDGDRRLLGVVMADDALNLSRYGRLAPGTRHVGSTYRAGN